MDTKHDEAKPGEVVIHRVVARRAYPKNGNLHNPTVEWAWWVVQDGRVIDRASKLRALRADYPGARIVRHPK